jgi:uncharacterized protein
MKELVAFMAASLVENPESVTVKEIEAGSSIVIELSVAPEEVGRVIGKQGRVARAMRTLLAAAGSKQGKHVTLEIM